LRSARRRSNSGSCALDVIGDEDFFARRSRFAAAAIVTLRSPRSTLQLS